MGAFKLFLGSLSLKAKVLIVGAIILMLAISHGSVYYIGYTKGANISAVQIAQYEKQVSDLQGQVTAGQARINQQVVVEYRDRWHTIENTRYINRDVIRTNVVSRPDSVAIGWINAHNDAAAGLPIDPTRASDATPSGVPDASLLVPITNNYATFQQCRAQVDAWQTWYSATRTMYDTYRADRDRVENERRANRRNR